MAAAHLLLLLAASAAGRHLDADDVGLGAGGDGAYPEELNPTLTDGGLTLIESDIVLPEGVDRRALMAKRWPLGEAVPFVVTPEVEQRRTNIEAGISHIEDVTCVTFREEPVEFAGAPHLRFINGSGCYSFLGQMQNKLSGQSVSIGKGCAALVTVAHEISHALGFFHEQSRPDRDQYVEVLWDNIKQGKEANFRIKENAETLGVKYDFRSIMHYAKFAFSTTGMPTLRSVDPLQGHLVGRRIGEMTHRDRAITNIAYQCANHCTEPPACQNEGYVDKFCQCVCPEGVEGALCENVPDDYSYYGPVCGDADITTPGVITSPGYPDSMEKDRHCYWLVTAPSGFAVRLTVTDVSMNDSPNCKRDRMSIRVEGDLRDEIESDCNTRLTGRSFVSVGNRLLVYFRTRGRSSRGRRFSGSVEFVPDV
ncbi:blastula protease 10-like [Pollicipes pollicipes]|uniref:blastula protease 10-like n=1 Tax=Pollicipes pollicipes TaxID=41117 RepID=UPI001885A2E3|nr:blastula protease 10-like [Pollicipes pollicipes]